MHACYTLLQKAAKPGCDRCLHAIQLTSLSACSTYLVLLKEWRIRMFHIYGKLCGINGHQVAVGSNRLGLWPMATRWCWYSVDGTWLLETFQGVLERYLKAGWCHTSTHKKGEQYRGGWEERSPHSSAWLCLGSLKPRLVALTHTL